MIPSGSQTSIRPYQPSDLPEFRRICLSTGLNGQLDQLFCDQDAFIKIWLGPYLTLSPESCLTAVQNGKVVGYLVGTYDDGFTAKAAVTLIPVLIRLFVKWSLGRYRHHPPTGRFLKWLFLRSWKEHPKTPKNSCSFHFNVDLAEGRDSMAGFMLGRAFLDEARRRGKPHWHAVVFAGGGRRPVKVYEKLGFTILDRRPCSLFEGGKVELATITKKVSAESGGLID